jgi:hypothetical protein
MEEETMVQTLELKRSNLVLPTSGCELDREEMCYVEGGAVFKGFYTTHNAEERNAGALMLFTIAGALALVTLMCKDAMFALLAASRTAAVITGIIGAISGVFSGSALIAAIDALDYIKRGVNYTIGMNYIWGVIPAGLSIQ